jgi:hypothetical protein
VHAEREEVMEVGREVDAGSLGREMEEDRKDRGKKRERSWGWREERGRKGNKNLRKRKEKKRYTFKK